MPDPHLNGSGKPIDFKAAQRERNARARASIVRGAFAEYKSVAAVGVVIAAIAVVTLQDFGFALSVAAAVGVLAVAGAIIGGRVIVSLFRGKST